jgi:hypothetical protein
LRVIFGFENCITVLAEPEFSLQTSRNLSIWQTRNWPQKPFSVKISMAWSSRTLPIRTEIVTFTRFRAGSPHKLPAFATMPTQRESCVTADERRCRRLLLASAVWVCLGVEQQTICSSACLVLWLRRRRELRRVRSLRVRMLSRTFSLAHESAYDVVSQMRFSKRDITTLASRMPWRETIALAQVRTARRRYVASPEEAMAILRSRLSMLSRVEDLEQRFCRSKGAIYEIVLSRWPRMSGSTPVCLLLLLPLSEGSR